MTEKQKIKLKISQIKIPTSVNGKRNLKQPTDRPAERSTNCDYTNHECHARVILRSLLLTKVKVILQLRSLLLTEVKVIL